jgi:hypothetical protein
MYKCCVYCIEIDFVSSCTPANLEKGSLSPSLYYKSYKYKFLIYDPSCARIHSCDYVQIGCTCDIMKVSGCSYIFNFERAHHIIIGNKIPPPSPFSLSVLFLRRWCDGSSCPPQQSGDSGHYHWLSKWPLYLPALLSKIPSAPIVTAH